MTIYNKGQILSTNTVPDTAIEPFNLSGQGAFFTEDGVNFYWCKRDGKVYHRNINTGEYSSSSVDLTGYTNHAGKYVCTFGEGYLFVGGYEPTDNKISVLDENFSCVQQVTYNPAGNPAIDGCVVVDGEVFIKAYPGGVVHIGLDGGPQTSVHPNRSVILAHYNSELYISDWGGEATDKNVKVNPKTLNVEEVTESSERSLVYDASIEKNVYSSYFSKNGMTFFAYEDETGIFREIVALDTNDPFSNKCSYPIKEVVAEICIRAGIDASDIDSLSLEGNVNGFRIDNTSEAYEHLLKLSEAFFFDPSNYDGVLHFKHRGSDPVLEILENDIIGDGADEKVRKMPQSIPRVLNLNYFDVDGGIDTDKQTSDRSIDTRGEDQENIDTDIVMTADFAQQLAIKKHKVIIEEQKGELDLTLPFDYIGLVVGDVVTFKNERYRCKEVNIEDGTLDVTLIYDRKSAYESNATGIPPVAPPDPISVVPGETTIQFLDTHILSSGDDSQLGFYIGISGAKPAWKGATVEISEDGGNTWLDSQQASVPAIMGELVTELGDHKKEIPDTHNTVQIQIITPNLALESATLTEMMNRKNRAIIGNEIVSFGNVSEVSEGVWEIDYFLRGRLGTDAVSHAIGERFVMLDRSFIEYYPTEKYNIGQPLTFRATSFNSSTQTTITETFTAKSQTAPKVGYLRARRIDGGQVKIDWIGTGVKGGKASVDHSDYFTGYRVDVGGTITDTTNETLTTAISGSPTTIKVYQINSFTGAGPAEEITV